jgi:hypothetical protein
MDRAHDLVFPDETSARAWEEGFCQSNSGKALRMEGSLLVPEQVGAAADVVLTEVSPRMRVSLNGRRLSQNQALRLPSGPAALVVEGVLAPGLKGPLKLSLLSAGRDLVAKGMLLRPLLVPAWRAEGRNGEDLQSPGEWTPLPPRWSPSCRFYDYEDSSVHLKLPFTYALTCEARMPAAAVLQFRFEAGKGRILVDGKPVFVNHPYGNNLGPLPVSLAAGQRFQVRIESIIAGPEKERAVAPGVRKEGEEAFVPVGWDWGPALR